MIETYLQFRARCNATNRRYKERNREALRAASRQYYQANKEKMLIKARDYGDRNKSKILEARRKWRLNNLEKHKQCQKSWRLRNPVRTNEYSRTYRAKKHSYKTLFPKQIVEWEAMWARKAFGACAWCSRMFLSCDLETDHITPISKGGAHEMGNLVKSCRSCNRKKNNKSLDEWLDILIAREAA